MDNSASSSTIIINSGGIINSNGIMNNEGDVDINSGQVRNTGLGTITNAGDIIINSTGALLGIGSGSTITNTGSGTLTNNPGGFVNITFGAIINNTGTITNAGDINMSDDAGGTITNNNGGTLTNNGTITINSSSSTIINNASSTFTNTGSGIITNNGTMDLIGGLTNDGLLNNDCYGIFDPDQVSGNAAVDICEPIANGQSASTDEDTDLEIIINGTNPEVAGNPFQNQNLTFFIQAQPAHGSLAPTNVNTTTSAGLTYTPDPNFSGTDSFTFLVNDGTSDSTSATVSITVNSVAEEDDDDDDDDDDDERHRRGGGGSNRVVIINNNDNQQQGCPVTTYSESYFADNPLDRICVSNPSLIDAFGVNITDDAVVTVGQQVSITATLSNHQEMAQDYAFIVQITDEEGRVMFIAWQDGNIESGNTADISISWTPEQPGNYTVRIFVWDGLQPPAQPLSTVTSMNIEVTTEQ
ncbi:MAG TPA: Ig-like domain-containing protein [Nitrososphaera sp.]